ncbi:ChrR family anti-sigma-E factor [Rheinheimera baltica]|uniref:ChrR family anti-sigma-E factor n=1 Tax=Rheinheimera baltica TaxID=67576 RepID=UPI00273EA122|nr:ChrR family anti-sigma-E factor [Rheinheimera baltica]MDP5151267.1 ChrR family anti-sigma-E factor [Rheinheimera baltica]MDP5189928.1 ChrR family anti-sigma-E factor [Rheinheimera baltica]
MAHAIKFHPGMSLLEQFAEGCLSADVALAVAAHIDLCPHCQQLHNDVTADLASQVLLQPVKADNTDWNSMLSNIVANTDMSQQDKPQAERPQQLIEVSQRQFELPRALRRLGANHGKWLHLGGIATAKLPTGNDHHVSLLYISKDTEVPQHTHLGLEMTLVLAGKIVDENGEYHAGDLLINSPDDTHTPRTMADEDCLCLSVLSAPLHFKKGLTRLLNPLQQFFY